MMRAEAAAGRRAARPRRLRRRAAARPGRSRPAGRARHQPRPRGQSLAPESGAQDRGNAGQGHPDRAAAAHRHAQRRRRRHRHPHRSVGAERHASPSTSRSTGALPGARVPDLSVDGTIELERLDDVLFVGRPAFGQEQSAVGLFKLQPNGDATRVQVTLGRSSVNTVEIVVGPERRAIRSSCRTCPPGTRSIASACNSVKEHDANGMPAARDQAGRRDQGVSAPTRSRRTRSRRSRPRDRARANTSRSPGPRAAASPRCSRSSVCSTPPTGGTVRLNGRPVTELTASERARVRNREIGFIFQSFNLIGDLTVFENVELPLTYRGMRPPERRQRVARRARARRHGASRQAPAQSALRRTAAARRRGPRRRRRAGASCSPTSRPATSIRRAASR